MHSGLSFCALLAGILFILFMQDVEALPVIRNKSASKTVTLPLKRLETSSRNVHPQVLLQQHLNRSNRRLARMTGNEAPTDQALRRNIQKRVLSLEQEQVYKRFNRYTPPVPNTKRFNRGGVTPHNNVVVPASLRRGHRKHGNNNNDDQAATAAGNGTTTTKGKGGVAAGAAGGAAGGAAAGAASGSGSAGNDNSNSTTTANGSDTVTAAEEPAADNSIGLDIESVDVGYLATIQMGTPPQDFSLLMDSGSADTWVGGENCVSEDGGDCGAHTFLGAQSSSSFVDSGNAFQVTYGTGAVEGTIVQDDIVVAGLNLDAHNFGVATTESVEFSGDQTSFDGLVGLAQSSLSEQGVPTPPEALAAAGLIDGAITSYKISRLADGLNDGEITFGGLDETKFDAKTLVTLDNVNANGFWEADVDSATVDGVDLGLAGRTAILDTGTTLMIVPAEDALAIHQQIDGAATDGQGGFTVPCTTTQSIALTFGGQEFTIDPRDLAFQPLDPANPEGDCISGIGAGNIGAATQWLVGDTFLKNAYFSHSVDDNTISLAKLV